MINVKELVELAASGHRHDIDSGYLRRHVQEECATCVSITEARKKVEQAEEHGEVVVLYIP